ncbi:hypothetical protein [Polaribacter sp. IC073]|uniref:hypothetical protein n=1 Tax=Polaribacter sp. IC073 TaxID=2508540 RepID=UPI0011BF994E|nr:hypothetical protein [Polaribacter sp. IC073]TXD49624.1 hypothetical protein ES045_00100 [Polaribacter sp. IC073]
MVQKTKLDLEKLDENNQVTWGERKNYTGSLLPISVEPKLRSRAFSFMDGLINLIEANGHGFKIAYNRLHIEMYGQLTEFNLRQKYYRLRVKGDYSFSHNTFVKSDDLEFQVGSYARKGWIDKKTIKIEDYLPKIYSHIEEKSKKWAEHRRHQKIEEKKREAQRKLEEEKEMLIVIENEKTEILIQNASNYKTAHEIRLYLKALEQKLNLRHKIDESLRDYIHWAYNKANEIDPLLDEIKD